MALADANDTTAPVIYAVAPSTANVWPPDHKMVPVTIESIVIDDTDPAPSVWIAEVRCDDPRCTADDIEITGPMSLNLRAQKSGNDDRVYTVRVIATDANGNASTATTEVRVARADRRDGF